jgi:hypothetical protein
MEFSKVDVAVHEHGPHSPVADCRRCGDGRRSCGSGGLTPAAFSVALDAHSTEEYLRRSAPSAGWRISAVPVVTLPAAPAGTGLEDEVRRLTGLTRLAAAEGVLLDVGTETGTLTEAPDVAVTL